LPKRFVDASFAFRSGVLYGVKEQLPRWQRCSSAADAALRTPLGKAFVARDFPPAAKARAKELVDNLQSVLESDIGTLGWMGPQTKQRAVDKLLAFTKKIGYPDSWVDYSTLTIADGTPYARLVKQVRDWNHARDMARIGKPTDRTLWGMTPPTVNAYYNPSNNEIVFPAGILQTPFFNATADDAVNYGAIGAVIGHEMTHGFDDQGRQFDLHGNLRDWWTAQDAANFSERAQCIVDEFDGFSPLPGLHENGKLVEGEAIADLGGTTIAFKAFERTGQYKAHRKIDGFTPEQRFFLAYAQVWRALETEAYTRQLAVVDPHPNDRLRVIGTLSNMPEFRAAFACAANSAWCERPGAKSGRGLATGARMRQRRTKAPLDFSRGALADRFTRRAWRSARCASSECAWPYSLSRCPPWWPVRRGRRAPTRRSHRHRRRRRRPSRRSGMRATSCSRSRSAAIPAPTPGSRSRWRPGSKQKPVPTSDSR
jgi:putative endopeptidase